MESLFRRLREDATLPDDRGAAWCEAVPGFLSNAIAGNDELRSRARDAWFPGSAAIVCSLCSRRPELAFMFLQTLASDGRRAEDATGSLTEAPPLIQQLATTEDGLGSHRKGGVGMSRDDVSQKAWEWASIFFHTLWMFGAFESAYKGVKSLTVAQLHSFWCSVNGFVQGRADAPPGVLELLVSRLCTRVEVLSLFWNTIHALESKPLLTRLLNDPGFISVTTHELADAANRLACSYGLVLHPAQIGLEASGSLGLSPEDFVATTSILLPAAAFEEHSPDQTATEVGDQAVCARLFAEICHAMLALSGDSRSRNSFPMSLAGPCLVTHVAFIDALHRMRFGNISDGVPKSKPTPEVVEASRACLLVEQVRICANLVYEDRRAQDFLRLTDGLRVVLCHCYADPELPLLREAGVFAVRNATDGNATNQAYARELLSAGWKASKQGAEGDSASGPAMVHPAELGLGDGQGD